MKFLTLEKEAFGLDISDMSLKIIKLKRKTGFFKLASFNHLEIQPGVIEKGAVKDEDALAKVIQAACRNIHGERLRTKYVIASLPEERSFLEVIKMPLMKEEELKLAVPFEAENYIPLPMSEVYLDFEVIAPIKSGQNHLDVLIVAMPKKIVNSYVACIKKAGLIPLAMEVESEAIARALVKNELSTAPIALIDFGKNSTDFIVFAGRSIQFTHSIAISSQQLTAAIAKALGIDLAKSEKLKVKYDLAIAKTDYRSKKIQQAITPILEDLCTQIKKYLDFYQEHTSHEHTGNQGNISKIFLCGGGANLKGLAQFLSGRLEVPVEVKDSWMHFSARQLNDDVNKTFLSFATALGLALRGANDSTD